MIGKAEVRACHLIFVDSVYSISVKYTCTRFVLGFYGEFLFLYLNYFIYFVDIVIVFSFESYNVGNVYFRLGNGWQDLCSQDPMTEIRELPPRPLPPISVNNVDGDDTNSSVGPSLISPQNAPHPRDESDIEALRACWAPKIRETVASRLPGNLYRLCKSRMKDAQFIFLCTIITHLTNP